VGDGAHETVSYLASDCVKRYDRVETVRSKHAVAKRLVDTYRLDETVEVVFQDEEGEEAWRPARVVGLQHPGVWVLTGDRRTWYVTNGKRIRPQFPSPFSSQERGEGQGEG
jgi:hypothetical protein